MRINPKAVVTSSFRRLIMEIPRLLDLHRDMLRAMIPETNSPPKTDTGETPSHDAVHGLRPGRMFGNRVLWTVSLKYDSPNALTSPLIRGLTSVDLVSPPVNATSLRDSSITFFRNFFRHFKFFPLPLGRPSIIGTLMKPSFFSQLPCPK